MTSFKFLTKFATKKAMGLMLLSVMAFSAVVAIVGGMGKQQQQQNQVTVQVRMANIYFLNFKDLAFSLQIV